MPLHFLLSPTFQQKKIQLHKEAYHHSIEDMRSDIQAGFDSKYLGEFFLSEIKSIVFEKNLDQYNFLNFYWTTLIEKVITISQIHEECDTEDEYEIKELEEEAFNFWNQSEYAQSFSEFLAEGEDVISASHSLTTLLENQIMAFFHLHVSSRKSEMSGALPYTVLSELGDCPDWIKIGPSLLSAHLEKTSDLFPTVVINNVSDHCIDVEIDGDTYEVPLVDETSKLVVDGHPLYVSYSCKKGLSLASNISGNIKRALDIISKANPHLFKTFFNFTHTIIPVDEPGIVSYSMQELPGISCINLFERDFLDLIDDLLHENGHHYLNTLLNTEELIVENAEIQFYSPWREAPRPIRGIYHATFTFYWALQLFCDLKKYLQEQAPQLFTAQEIIKINKRICEEFLMLSFCQADLFKARDLELVSVAGYDLISEVFSLVDEKKACFEDANQFLKNHSPEHCAEIDHLKNTLIQKRKEFGHLSS